MFGAASRDQWLHAERADEGWVPKEQDSDWTYCYTYDRL